MMEQLRINDLQEANGALKKPEYGTFWVANAISSTLLGMNNRELQTKAFERNKEFLLEKERASFLTDDVRLQEEIAFKRRLVTLSRKYSHERSVCLFNEQMKLIEFKHFIKHCWPLESGLPLSILNRLNANNYESNNSNLNVILLHTPLLPLRAYGSDVNELDAEIYSKIEYSMLMNDIPSIGNIDFFRDACVKPDMTGGNASIMNIHFIMSQLPTLVIAPKYQEGFLHFTGAVWEAHSARPIIRPLFKLQFDPVKASLEEDYRNSMIDLLQASISIIVGIARDSYVMISLRENPTFHKWINDRNHIKMRQIAMENETIKSYIHSETQSLLNTLDDVKIPELERIFCIEEINALRKEISYNSL